MSSIVELKTMVSGVKNRSELLRLREEIGKYIDSPEFKLLTEDDKEYVIDLLAEIHSKEDQFTGCDPLNRVSSC